MISSSSISLEKDVSADCLSRTSASKPDITDVEKVSESYYHVASAVSVAADEAECSFRLQLLRDASEEDIE